MVRMSRLAKCLATVRLKKDNGLLHCWLIVNSWTLVSGRSSTCVFKGDEERQIKARQQKTLKHSTLKSLSRAH